MYDVCKPHKITHAWKWQKDLVYSRFWFIFTELHWKHLVEKIIRVGTPNLQFLYGLIIVFSNIGITLITRLTLLIHRNGANCIELFVAR